MNRYTVAVLVQNKFGVLNKVTSMFRRRQFNISSLTVSETESNEFSRITVTFDGDEIKEQQLVNQLYKLPDGGFYLKKDHEKIKAFFEQPDQLPELMKNFDFAESAFYY